jgi:hypothetical protein
VIKVIKATARMRDGRVLLVIGISDGNVERLKEGEPIYFDPAALRIPPGATIGAITLFYGRDEAELTRMIRTLIGPQTEIITVPRGDKRPQ